MLSELAELLISYAFIIEISNLSCNLSQVVHVLWLCSDLCGANWNKERL